MKPALECREKVHAALTLGATAIDPQLTLAWEEVAREWTALAVQAELYETLRAKFFGQNLTLLFTPRPSRVRCRLRTGAGAF